MYENELIKRMVESNRSLPQINEPINEDSLAVQTIRQFEKAVLSMIKESLDDNDFLLPPWIKYPEIPHGSIGWRMGYGEDYLILFGKWINLLNNKELQQYKNKYPPPKEREQFYQNIIKRSNS